MSGKVDKRHANGPRDCLDEDGLCICDCPQCAPPGTFNVCICPECDRERCGLHPDGTSNPPVLVNPSDPATIERAARAAHHYDVQHGVDDVIATESADACWESDSDKDYYKGVAAAVLASLTSTDNNHEGRSE